MAIWDVCIRRPVFTTMLVLGPVVLGLASYARLGVELFPNVDVPVVVVTTTLKGSGVEEMESSVTKPIEEAVNTVNGIDELRSTTKEGVSVVVIGFKLERDGEAAAQDVRDKVSTILASLPVGTDPPKVERFNLDAAPVVTVAVSGRRDIREITEIAKRQIKEDLEGLLGVGQVVLVGGRTRAVNVTLRPDQLQSRKVSAEDVRRTLAEQNVELPGGKVTSGPAEQNARVMGRVKTWEDFRDLVVAVRDDAAGGKTITRVRDVATVDDGWEEERGLSRLDGDEAVSLVVQKQSGGNTVAVAERVRARLEEIQKSLPADIRVEVIRDQSKFIKGSIEEVKFHLLLAALLVSGVIFLFIRDWRTTLIAATAVPTSIIGTFAFMDAMGFSLNNMTLLGLILAVGIVIDDAVVVLENVFRHMEEEGRTAWEAASTATKEIALAVLATTLSLAVIFAPIAFMSGQVGRFFNSFGFVVGFSILLSMCVSFTLTPMLCARFLKAPKRSPEPPNPPGPPSLRGKGGDAPTDWPDHTSGDAGSQEALLNGHPSPLGGGAGGGVATSALGQAGGRADAPNPPGPPSLRGKGGDAPTDWPDHTSAEAGSQEALLNGHPSPLGGGAGGGVATHARGQAGRQGGHAPRGVWAWITRRYVGVLAWSLRHRWVIVVATVGCFLSTPVLFGLVGSDFVPKDDQSEFEVSIILPEGTSLGRASEVCREVEGRLAKVRGVTNVFTTIGPTDGRAPKGQGDVTRVTIYCRMTDLRERAFGQRDAMADARLVTADYPDLRATVQEVNLFSSSAFKNAQVDVSLRGPDSDKLNEYAAGIVRKMRATGRYTDVDTNAASRSPELQVHIDRDRVADQGVNVRGLATALGLLVGGEPVTRYKEGPDQYDVWLRAELPSRDREDAVFGLTVPAAAGKLVELRNIAQPVSARGPAAIERYARQRQVSIQANLGPGVDLGTALPELEGYVTELNLSPEYRHEFLGEAKLMKDSNANFLLAFLLAFVFMYMILAAQFESLVHPITILLAVPLTLPFALVSLLILRTPLDVYAMIGLFMLFGIVKKNGILQVDYTNVLRAKGVPRDAAILRANEARLRPILMTTVMLVAAMIPIATGEGPGAGARASMAKVILGGQLLSLLLTLLLTPVAYSLWDDFTDRLKRVVAWWKRPRKADERGRVSAPCVPISTPV